VSSVNGDIRFWSVIDFVHLSRKLMLIVS